MTARAAELESARARLAAVKQEVEASVTALHAAEARLQAALQEMQAASEHAHKLLHPPESYN